MRRKPGLGGERLKFLQDSANNNNIINSGVWASTGMHTKTPHHTIPRDCIMFLKRREICDSNSAFQQEQVDVKGLFPSECLLEMT